jgi:hypothetical protein
MSKKTNKSENESGGEWLNYKLMLSEIELYRNTATRRIQEHLEHFNPLEIPNLYHVAQYYEAIGVAAACNCLEIHCKDFKFTEEDIIEIIRKEKGK